MLLRLTLEPFHVVQPEEPQAGAHRGDLQSGSDRQGVRLTASIVVDQAENRLHIIKAILVAILG
jgi:hypothetical protein